MRAALGLLFDLLEHPAWFACITASILGGIGLIVVTNDRAKAAYRRDQQWAAERKAGFEQAQRDQQIHLAARSIRCSHPDHRFNLDADDRAVLAELGIAAGDEPQEAA